MAEEKCLRLLPLDVQASVLSFLARGDLAHFSTVSKECLGVATIVSLWLPLLVYHFGDVVPPTPLLTLDPARRFRALALTPCSVCKEILLPPKPRVDPKWSRYSVIWSCVLCGLLCCTACHCRCRCLNDVCRIGVITANHNDCRRCHG
jgi:hypothetical protein